MKIVAVAALCALSMTAQAPPRFALEEATVEQLQKWMQSGRYTSQALTRMYLERIRLLDKQGPRINSVIELNPDALAIAADLDRERRAGKVRGSLHGIPMLIKDNIDTGDKMMTTAGSLSLVGAPALKDAFLVKRLREAGAVILGKTNLSEWANFRSTNSTSDGADAAARPRILTRSIATLAGRVPGQAARSPGTSRPAVLARKPTARLSAPRGRAPWWD